MKVLYVVSGLVNKGGIETFCLNTVPKLIEKGVTIDFLINSPEVGEIEEDFIALGSKMYHVNQTSGISKIQERRSLIKKIIKDYDCIHIHTVLTTCFETAFWAKLYGIKKVIVHSHTASNYEGFKFKNDLCRFLLNMFTDCRIACSKLAGEFLFGKRKAKKTEVVFNSVDMDKFYFDEDIRIETRGELGVGDKFVVGNIGRLSEAKNQQYLMEIFQKFNENTPNSILLIAGEGDYRERLEKYIEDNNLQDKVILLGNRRDVNSLMNAFDVFLFPSLYEGLPTVLIEAQVVGLPCVMSDRITDEVVISNNVKRLSIDNADSIETWVNAIDINSEKQPLSKEEAKCFEQDGIVEQLIEIYNSLRKQ